MKTFKLFLKYLGLLALVVITCYSTFHFLKEKKLKKKYNSYYLAAEDSLEAIRISFPEQFEEFLQSMQFVEYYRARENLKEIINPEE